MLSWKPHRKRIAYKDITISLTTEMFQENRIVDKTGQGSGNIFI